MGQNELLSTFDGLGVLRRHSLMNYQEPNSSNIRVLDCKSGGPWFESNPTMVLVYHILRGSELDWFMVIEM